MLLFLISFPRENYSATAITNRDTTFDVTTSDLMFLEIFLTFDVHATNLMLKTIFIL